MNATTAPSQHNVSLVAVLRDSLVDVVGSIALFLAAKHFGASDVNAYLIASLAPATAITVGAPRTRTLSVMGLIVLAWTLLGAGLSLVGGQDGRTLLLKDSAVTGTIGLVMLASMLPIFGKPILYYFGQRFGTDNTPEGLAVWNLRYETSRGFQHTMRIITGVWGLGLLVEAAARVGIVESINYTAAFALNQVLPIAFIAALITRTIRYGKTRAARGAAVPASV